MKKQLGATDEEVMALFSRYNIPDLKELKCKEQKTVAKLCVSPQCEKHSLLCDDLDCKFCGEKIHLTCRSVRMKGITSLFSSILDRQKDFILDINKIDAKFIEELNNSKVSMVKKYYLGDMEEKYLKIVQEMFQKKNSECLMGKQAKEFYKKLIKSNEQAHLNNNVLLEHYNKAMEEFLKQILDLKNTLHELYVKGQKINVNFPLNMNSKIIQTNCFPTFEDIKSRNLKTKEQLNFLVESLGSVKNIQLIFRASEHNFRAAAFHEKCGEVENTLTLVRTEFGRTIAAFTPYKWHSVPNGNWVSNAAGGTCILSLDRREKLVPTNTSYLIYNNSGYGPIFGNGNDLLICDQCNTNNNSYNATGVNHNTADSKYKNDQAAWTALSGATNGKNFKVVEYEVFRVIR